MFTWWQYKLCDCICISGIVIPHIFSISMTSPSSDCSPAVDDCLSNLCKSQQVFHSGACGGEDYVNMLHFAAGDQEHGVILLVALQQQWLYFLWRLRAWSDPIRLHSVPHALNAITEARAWSKVYVSEEWRAIINWLSIPFENTRLDIRVLFYDSKFFGVPRFNSITKDQTSDAIENPVLLFFVCVVQMRSA